MNHGELKVPSSFGRPSRDTQNLVLSLLFLFIPFQNIENKFLRLQYIGAPKSSWLGKKLFEVKQAEHQEKVAIGNTGCPKKRYKLNAAGVTVHRSPVAGIPYFWKLFFGWFLIKTNQDQALPNHVDEKNWPHSTQFRLGFVSVSCFILGHIVFK